MGERIDLAYADPAQWRIAREYLPGKVRAVYIHSDGTRVGGTFWGVDDGSAEAEAGAAWLRFMERHGYRRPRSPRPEAAAPTPRRVPAPYTLPATIDPPSEAMELDLDGCSCHINPPCGFCELLTEQETSAFCYGGIDALRMLWRAWEDQQEVTRG